MSAVCPAGHTSTTSDYCDTCGARIGAAPAPPAAAPAVAVPTTAPAPAREVTGHCPNGHPRTGDDRFCEVCGFDWSTGKVPELAAPSAAPQPVWSAVVTADRAWYEAQDDPGVPFPDACPPRTVTLTGDQVRIGRRSASRGLDAEIDLTGPPLDPGVSHLHALLTRGPSGAWLLSDPGSTNGTMVNDDPAPLAPGISVTMADGDRIRLGAWTTITLHAT